jgi:F0F1-type ATP synthase delta subunit
VLVQQVEPELISPLYLQLVGGLLDNQSNFEHLLADPTVSRQDKLLFVKDISDAAGLHPSTAGFLGSCLFWLSTFVEILTTVSGVAAVLAENGRLPLIKSIIDVFGKYMSLARKEVAGKVISADILDSANKQKLTESLRQYISEGETINLEYEVGPCVLSLHVPCIHNTHLFRSIHRSLVG